MRSLTPLRAILYGGIVVGSFDAAYAIVFWALRSGVAPIRIFQSIAAGLLGREAFQGGMRTALLGAALHFGISFAIVAVYCLASRFLHQLVRHPILCGAIYGVSAATPSRFIASWVICSIGVHAFLVGVPAALFARAAIEGKGQHADR